MPVRAGGRPLRIVAGGYCALRRRSNDWQAACALAGIDRAGGGHWLRPLQRELLSPEFLPVAAFDPAWKVALWPRQDWPVARPVERGVGGRQRGTMLRRLGPACQRRPLARILPAQRREARSRWRYFRF